MSENQERDMQICILLLKSERSRVHLTCYDPDIPRPSGLSSSKAGVQSSSSGALSLSAKTLDLDGRSLHDQRFWQRFRSLNWSILIGSHGGSKPPYQKELLFLAGQLTCIVRSGQSHKATRLVIPVPYYNTKCPKRDSQKGTPIYKGLQNELLEGFVWLSNTRRMGLNMIWCLYKPGPCHARSVDSNVDLA